MALRARRVRGGWIVPRATAADLAELDRGQVEHPYKTERRLGYTTTTTTYRQEAANGGGNGAAGAGGMSGGGGSQDYGWIGTMVDDARDGWYASVLDQQKQLGNDPCQFSLAVYQTWEQFGRGALRNTLAAATKVSRALREAVARSLDNWGYGEPYYIGGKGFGQYLLDNGVVDLELARAGIFFAAGPIGLGIFDAATNKNLRNRLPVAGRAPSSRAKGYEISPGAWLYDPGGTTGDDDLARGKLQGPAVRAAYSEWVKYQRRRVSPGAFPDARNQLGRWVGDEADRWYVWKSGKPISDNSKAGGLIEAEAAMWKMYHQARGECMRQRLWTEEQIELGGERAAVGARERLIALVAVGGFAAWSLKR